MEWRCRECGRTHDEPPEACTCGSADVGPREDVDAGRGRYSLLAIRERLLDPRNADRSLVRDEPYLALAFRLLLTAAVLATVSIALVLLF